MHASSCVIVNTDAIVYLRFGASDGSELLSYICWKTGDDGEHAVLSYCWAEGEVDLVLAVEALEERRRIIACV